MNFPFESSHYEMIREIDCNNYSKQFIARCLTNSKLVAMKKINLEIFPFTIEGLRNEINYWVMLDHPNMLKYYGSFVEKTFLYIIVEYIDGWELSDILKERHPNGFKDEVLIASILHPVLTFLSYYHQMHYIHRSLESKHIFLKMDGDVKVGGFWKAKTLFNQENSQNDKDSNTEYNALIENEHIQQSGDIWNLGILAIEMATGKTQYSDVSSLGQVKSIVDGKASSAFLDFISLCLEKDSKKRPTAKELLKHKFLSYAKKKDYINLTLMSVLPPLSQRVSSQPLLIKKLLLNEPKMNASVSFDFGEYDQSSLNNNHPQEKPPSQTVRKGRFTITMPQFEQ